MPLEETDSSFSSYLFLFPCWLAGLHSHLMFPLLYSLSLSLPPITSCPLYHAATTYSSPYFSKTGLQSPDAQAEDPSGETLGVRTDQRIQRGRWLKVWPKKGQEWQWVRKSRRRWSKTMEFVRKEVGEGDCFTCWGTCTWPAFQLENSD